MLNTSILPSLPSLRPCCYQLHGSRLFDARRRPAASIRCSARQPEEAFRRTRPLALGFAAMVAAGLTHFCPPAYAELETVSAASATTIAKPIKEQKVDKEKVWLIFILGAAGLFGGTLLLENNERFFPAIYKANLAMSQAKKAMKAKAKVENAIDIDGGERVQSAVEAGLLEASRRQVSQEGASAPSEKVVSEQHQQQDSPSSSAPAEAELQQTSDEHLQAAIQQLRNQQQDSDSGHAEDGNGSEARESSAVTVKSPKQS